MAQILCDEAKEDLSQILRCPAEARLFYSLHSDTTIAEASAGLADAISSKKRPEMVDMFSCDVTGEGYGLYSKKFDVGYELWRSVIIKKGASCFFISVGLKIRPKISKIGHK